jgi:hypothetical protein
MVDSTLNSFISRGPSTNRIAYTPSPPTPAVGADLGYFWFETDTGYLYSWNGSSWINLTISSSNDPNLKGLIQLIDFTTVSGPSVLDNINGNNVFIVNYSSGAASGLGYETNGSSSYINAGPCAMGRYEFTIAIRFKTTSNTTGPQYFTDPSLYNLALSGIGYDSGLTVHNGYAATWGSWNTSADYNYVSSILVNDGNFHTIVWTSDGKTVKVYVDGVNAGIDYTGTFNLPYGNRPGSVAYDYPYMGAVNVSDFEGGFYGGLDATFSQLRVYSYGMTSGEVAALDLTQNLVDITTSISSPLYYPSEPKGRLTLTSGTPIMSADVVGGTSIYFTPYKGKSLDLYDGTNWKPYSYSELTLALDTSNHVSGHIYDIFVFKQSGTITIGAGPAWSSSSARGTGTGTTELDFSLGLPTNKNVITLTNGSGGGYTNISVNTALYVGSFYATGNGQTSQQFNPAPANGGANPFMALYNGYHRALATCQNFDDTLGNSSQSGGWQPLRNSTSNRITFLDGLGQSQIEGWCSVYSSGNANGGMNFDSVSAVPKIWFQADGSGTKFVTDQWAAQLGLHYVQQMMSAVGLGVGSINFYTNASAPYAYQIQNLRVSLEL